MSTKITNIRVDLSEEIICFTESGIENVICGSTELYNHILNDVRELWNTDKTLDEAFTQILEEQYTGICEYEPILINL